MFRSALSFTGETMQIEETNIPLRTKERRICAVNFVSKSKSLLLFDWDFPKSEYTSNVTFLVTWLKNRQPYFEYRIMETEGGIHLYKQIMPNMIEQELEELRRISNSDYSIDLGLQLLRISPKWSYYTGIIMEDAPSLYIDTGCNPFKFPYTLEMYEKVDKWNEITKSFPPIEID